MSFEEKKVPAFEHPISQLADQPNMQPGELKAYFDANPEILRQGLNGLCDALGDTTAAANLGFAQTAGVPESTVQDAIENVQAQVTAAIVGSIPSGSINGDKLAQDVRNRFSAIESAATTEASARASADSNLQSQINTLTATKCEIYTGTYVGNTNPANTGTQNIALGFRPKAVIIMRNGFISNTDLHQGYYRPSGGIALDGFSWIGCTITDTGFTVLQTYGDYNQTTQIDAINLNMENVTYAYIAFK